MNTNEALQARVEKRSIPGEKKSRESAEDGRQG